MLKQLISGIPVQSFFDSESVSILFNEVHSLVLVIWKRQITLKERKIGFRKALELTMEHQLKYWLVDDLQLFIITPEEKDWVLTEFQEKASQTTLLKLAVVTADFYPALVANTDFTDQGKRGYEEKGMIQHEVFTDYDSALLWIFPEGID